MKSYELALSAVADSSAAAFAFAMPKTAFEWAQMVMLFLSIVSLVVGFIIKFKAIAENKRQKRITDEQASMQVTEEASRLITEAEKILSKYSKKGKYRIEEK